MPNLGNKPVAARNGAVIHNDELPLVLLLQVALIVAQDVGVRFQLRNDASGERDDPKGIRDTERIENVYP